MNLRKMRQKEKKRNALNEERLCFSGLFGRRYNDPTARSALDNIEPNLRKTAK